MSASTNGDVVARVIAMYQEGKPWKEITTATGVVQPAGVRMLVRHGIQLRHPGQQRRSLPDTIPDEYLAGATTVSLARRYNVSNNAIRSRLIDAGVLTPDRGSRRGFARARTAAQLEVQLPPEEVAELRRLQSLATTVRGNTPAGDPARLASEQLSKRLAEHVENRVSTNYLSMILGVQAQSIRSRLRRHGYRATSTSEGLYHPTPKVKPKEVRRTVVRRWRDRLAVRPAHGTETRWKQHKCRCPVCQSARAATRDATRGITDRVDRTVARLVKVALNPKADVDRVTAAAQALGHSTRIQMLRAVAVGYPSPVPAAAVGEHLRLNPHQASLFWAMLAEAGLVESVEGEVPMYRLRLASAEPD